MRIDARGVRYLVAVFTSVVVASTASGCATVGRHVRYGSLESKTEMRGSIFLDLTNEQPRTAYVAESDATGADVSVAGALREALGAAGYVIVEDASEATYVVQLNHRQLIGHELGDGQDIDDAIGNAFAAGYGAYLGAVAFGADRSAGKVGVLVGAGSFLIDARTRHMGYTLTTDVVVRESRSTPGGSMTTEHGTQIVAAASRVDLDRDDALPALVANLARTLQSLFPRE